MEPVKSKRSNPVVKETIDNSSEKVLEIIGGSKQNKTWRKNQKWYKTGKSNECEKYQIDLIKKITDTNDFEKTHDRLNVETFELKSVLYPMKEDDGFDWTENFDLKHISDKTIYFNLKFVCSEGGSQTRSMREVYHFMKAQIKYVEQDSTNQVYFINILDGDGSHKFMKKFSKLLNKQSEKIQNRIFVGDMLSLVPKIKDLFSK